MFYTDNKLHDRTNELASYRYRGVINLKTLQSKEDTEKQVRPAVPSDFSDFKDMNVGEMWTGRDTYLWLHKEVTIPAEWNGKRILGIFDYGRTGAGNNSGFESMFYLNGEMYQGVDSNHMEVFLPEDSAGKVYDFTFRLWSGLEGGGTPCPQEHRIKRSDIAWLDEATDDLYYMADMIVKTIKVLDDTNPIRHNLRTALDRALMVIDWSYPGSDEFYKTVEEADRMINEAIDGMQKDDKVLVKCIGHTHIDVAWLWRLKHTREKCSRSFSTVLRLMEQYPEYIFLQTQPQLYEYVKEDFPEIYEKIKERIAEGRWEADGGMWVEADCNLTSGESLTRQILIGSRFIKEEFDKDVEYLWLPDVFGYSWALPQILQKSGIPMFMTTKISWNQYNRMPHDTFHWIGIDGSKVLTHFITTPEPDSQPDSWFYTYNGRLLPRTVKGVWDGYSEKDMNQELLISYGFGDGGGGVNRDMLEDRRRIDKIPGLPKLETSTAGEYFRNLKKTVAETDQRIADWDGELYLEYHRGTYTSHAYNKMMNRKMELLYREAEWMTVMAAVDQGNIATAEQEKLTKGWKMILTNQFHDIIPGSSIFEVYEDSKVEYDQVRELALEVEESAKGTFITAKEDSYLVWNNSGWERSETVCIESEKELYFEDQSGTKLSFQKNGTTYCVYADHVPAMGYKTIYAKEGTTAAEEIPFNLTEKGGETPFYTIEWNKAGQITSLFDKENGVQVLRDGEKANVLQLFEDKPMGNEAWDIDIYYQEKMKEVTEIQHIRVKEQGNLRAVVEMEWKFANTTIRQDVIFYKENRRIDFKTWMDWKEKKVLLKAAFPVDIRSTYATYDIQYGNVRRPNHWNTSWDLARFETVAQKWVDLSEHGYGVSLLNDCKYGHDIKGNVMRITLLKSATYPDHSQDQGEHEFTYSLLPHSGDFVAGHTVKEAFALNQPLKVMSGSANIADRSFFTLSSESVEVDAVKQSEDKKYIVIRFHEYTGAKQNVTMYMNFDFTGYMESDLMERPIEELRKTKDITLKVKPYEIKTILIQL